MDLLRGTDESMLARTALNSVDFDQGLYDHSVVLWQSVCKHGSVAICMQTWVSVIHVFISPFIPVCMHTQIH